MNQEFYYHLLQGVRAKVTGYVCLVASICLLASVPLQKTESTKTASLLGALAVSMAGGFSLKTQKENDQAIEDFRVNSGIQRQRKLFGLPKVETVEAEIEPQEIEWFNFSTIGDDRDKFPNVIIMGEPGSGKTSLAEYLGVVLKANKRYAIHPHAKPNDFAGFNAVWGGGRNYGSPADEDVAWADIESGKVKPTIAQVLKSLLCLMNERYGRYYEGESNFDDVDVYIDELPSIVSNLGKKFFASIMPQLLMECRKVGIRLWLLSQGGQVRMLGLEGMSDLREGITFIRLGRLAMKHNRDKAIEQLLTAMVRPCLVDESPAKLPGWSEITGAIKSRQNATVVEKPKIQHKVDSEKLKKMMQELDVMTEDEKQQIVYIDYDVPYEGKKQISITDVKGFVDDALEARIYKELKEIAKRSYYNDDIMYYIGELLVSEHAKPISYVIKDGWGFEGENYKRGQNLYYGLNLHLVPKGRR